MKLFKRVSLAFSMALLFMPVAQLPAQAQTHVSLWHMEQPPHRVARIQQLIDEFNATHPEFIISQEPQNWGEIYAKAPTAVAAGAGPDMLFALPDFAPIFKDMGQLVSVEDFVAELDSAHGFVASAIQPYSYDGGVWAVPLYNMVMNLWYRKSDFAAAGLSVPHSWQEWQQAAEILSKDGRYGIGLPANKQLYTDQTLYSLMVNNGAQELYDEDGQLRFDNPQTIASYQYYADLQKLSPPDSPSWTWGEAEACFVSRSCAMILQFSVIASYDTQGGGEADDLGVAAIPYNQGMSQHATIAYSNGVMILSRDEQKIKGAKTFISWLLQPENYGRFLNMEPGLFLPVTTDGAQAASFWQEPMTQKYRPQIEQVIENSQNGKLFGFTSGRIFPSIAAISVQNLIAATLQDIVVNGQDAAQAVAGGQAKMLEATQ